MIDPKYIKIIGDYSELVILGIYIALGTIANVTYSYKTARETARAFKFADVIIGGVLCSFTGIMFATIGEELGFVGKPLYALAGGGAFGGVILLNELVKHYKDKLKERLK